MVVARPHGKDRELRFERVDRRHRQHGRHGQNFPSLHELVFPANLVSVVGYQDSVHPNIYRCALR